MLWKDVRHKLKGERGCRGESLQQPQNVTKQFLAVVWDGPKATGLVDHVIGRFDRLYLSEYNVSAVAEPLLPLHGFTENPVFITPLSFVSADWSVKWSEVCVACSSPALYLWVSRYGANFISTVTSFPPVSPQMCLTWRQQYCLGEIIHSYFLLFYKLPC